MKKIFVLLLTIALVVVMVGAAFTAAFSDVEQSSGNTLTAGTLNLTINEKDGKDAEAEKIDLGPLKPGNSGEAKCWDIRNEGSIPGILTFEVTNVVNYENGRLEMEEAAGDLTPGEKEGELGSQLQGTWRYLVPGTTDQWESWTSQYIDSMPGQEYSPDVGVLGKDDKVRICLDYSFVDTEENNRAQSDGVEFNVVFKLEQANND